MRRFELKEMCMLVCCLAAVAGVLFWWKQAPSADSLVSEQASVVATQAQVEGADAGEQSGGHAPETATSSSAAADAFLAEGQLGAEAENGSAGEIVPHVTIPADAEYDHNVVLVTLEEGMSVSDANALLSETDAVVAHEITQEELDSGVLELEVAPGGSVEEALNAVVGLPGVDAAQPNYIYYELLGDESDLRRLLAKDTALDSAAETLLADESSEAADTSAVEATVDSEQDADLQPEAESEPEASDPAATDAASDPIAGDPAETDKLIEAEDGTTDASDSGDEPALESLVDALDVNDPYSSQNAAEQWGLTSMQVYEAWAQVRCEGSVCVAVLENHPDVAHEDLAANVVSFYDIETSSTTCTETLEHGTHVTGIVSGVANNGIGVAGVSYNAGLLVINVFRDGYTSSGVAAKVTDTAMLKKAYTRLMDQAGQYNVRVVNLSFGGKRSFTSDDVLIRCIEDAYEQGIVTVAASGNSNLGKVPYQEYPGDAICVVSVINLKKTSTGVVRSDTSNYNVAGQRAKNISAPGASIYSTTVDNGYSMLSGTSMAAPHVAGVLALEFAANPTLTAKEAVSVLYDTAVDLGDSGWDEGYGYGEANALAAVTAAKDEQRVAEAVQNFDEAEGTAMPSAKGATRMPVGSTATYWVENGTLKLVSGPATFDGTTLTATGAGTVTLALLDVYKEQRGTIEVEVYDTSGLWTFSSAMNSSYVLDVSGGSLYNGGNVQLYSANGTRAQVWTIELVESGIFVVRSGKTGKALDVSGGSVNSGANVQQYRPNGTEAQQWRMTVDANNYVTLVNVKSGMALDVAGDAAVRSANVQQSSVDGTAAQKWNLVASTAEELGVWEGVYRIDSCLGNSLVLDVYGGSASNGANVQVWTSNGSNAQRWRVEYLGDGAYKITSVASGKVLDVAGGKLVQGTNIRQWTSNGTAAQRWEFASVGDGSYEIVRAGTTWAVDIAGGKAQRGTNVRQWTNNHTAAQRWKLVQY